MAGFGSLRLMFPNEEAAVRPNSGHRAMLDRRRSEHRRPCPELEEPRRSIDVDLLRDFDGIIDLNAEVTHCALDLRMS
jgi:hypothetical protein